jgi:universal stress protein E
MRRILCATDFLPKSEPAIDRAGALAQQFDADLSLLHVVSPISTERAFEESLQIAIGRMKLRVRPLQWRHRTMPETRVRAGNPAKVILETITQADIDLLVLGPHRRRALVDALEGTIAEKILSARKCPVLVVQRESIARYTTILLALDLSSESPAAVRAASTLLREAETRAIVVHAWQPPYKGMLRSVGVGVDQILAYSDYSSRQVHREIRQLLTREGGDRLHYNVEIVDAHAAPAILHAIDVYQPDLLILGTRGHGRLGRALLGSVANRLLSLAQCDVLVVPRGSVRSSNTQNLIPSLEHAG